jgi:hypothetical protein
MTTNYLGIAVDLAYRLEPIARLNGYHIALTGSTLHGPNPPADIDFLVYRHAGAKQTCDPHYLVMNLFKLNDVKQLTKKLPPPSEAVEEDEQYSTMRFVFEVYMCGIKINFLTT